MKFLAALRRALALLAVIGMITGGFAMPVSAEMMGMPAGLSQGMASMSRDMTSMAQAEEMPCHKDSSTKSQPCPFIANCLGMCFQNIPASPVFIVTRYTAPMQFSLPSEPLLEGVVFPPPPRPPRS
ncbi:MAG TPA: hypothetical protein VL402_09495 [Xanthobacteraceae bacterium]|jgi:hypothetical protein|nr:hypothetical protein [Xanthobacteraceae bacterium]